MFRKLISLLGTRVGIALLLAVCVIGISFVVKAKSDTSSTKKTPTALAVEKIVKKSLEDDTDGDGLKNWEEALYKTDPENPDTDGDGVNDGTEIATNRDPLISGVGHTASGTPSTSTTTTFTATDRFSQELFIRYIEAKKSGQPITQEFSDKLAEEIISKDYGTPTAVFDASSLLLITNPTLLQIHDYGNSFAAAISIPVPKGARSELEILDSVQTSGMTEIDARDLQILYDRYSTIHTKLASIRVPAEIRNTHTAFIRTIDTIRDSVSGIQNLDTDPIGSLKKIALYEDALNELSVASVSLKQYFVAKRITFASTEAGSAIMR